MKGTVVAVASVCLVLLVLLGPPLLPALASEGTSGPATDATQPPEPAPTPLPHEPLPAEPEREGSHPDLTVAAPTGAVLPSAVVAGASGLDLAAALGIAASDVVSTSFGTGDARGIGLVDAPLGFHFPRQGDTFVLLSTGLAESAVLPNNEANLSYALEGLKNSQGFDLVQWWLELSVPPSVNCVSFDYAFYSEEFPEFVGSYYNDTFTAELGGSDLTIVGDRVIAPLNFAFDADVNVVSVNTASGVMAPTDSTYDGMTPLRRAQTEVTPGQNALFVFSVQDLGDSIYDSAVMMDNFQWSWNPNCSAGTTPPPGSQSKLSLHMPESVPVGSSISPSFTVLHPFDGPAQYRVDIELRQGFGTLDAAMEAFQFVGSGTYSSTLHFGTYPAGAYYLVATLRENDEIIESQSLSFAVGQLGYLRLHQEAQALSDVAYQELLEGQGIAVDALAAASRVATKESVQFVASKLLPQVGGVEGVGEVEQGVLADLSVEIAGRLGEFLRAIEQSSYELAASFWARVLSEQTFSGREAAVYDAERDLIAYGEQRDFAWDAGWDDDVQRYKERLANVNETDRCAIGVSLDFAPPFVHRATLTEVKGQFRWAIEDMLPVVETLSTVLLVGLVVLLIVAIILLLLPAKLVLVASIVITGGKLVLAIFPVVLKCFYAVSKVKVIAGTAIIPLFALVVSTSAEEYASVRVVDVHGESMSYLQTGIAGVHVATTPLGVHTAVQVDGADVVVRSKLPSEAGAAVVSTQLFRGDGLLMSVTNHGALEPGGAVEERSALAPGTYWYVSAVRGAGEEVLAERTDFTVASAQVALEVDLQSDVLAPGQVLRGTIRLHNPEGQPPTGTLIVAAKTLRSPLLQSWAAELAADEAATFDLNLVPQEGSGDVLQVVVADAQGVLARADRAFVVGEGASVALNVTPEPTYASGADLGVHVTAEKAGHAPLSATVALETYDLNQGYGLVHRSETPLAMDADSQTSLELVALPQAQPGHYSSHLLVDGRIYRTFSYLVRADGTLFVTINAQQAGVSPSESVTAEVKVKDEAYAPTSAQTSLFVTTPTGERHQVGLDEVSTGVYVGAFTPTVAGTYTVRAVAERDGYVGAENETHVVCQQSSLLFASVEGRLVYDSLSSLRFAVTNEHDVPVAGALVVVSDGEGAHTGFTGEDGVALLNVPVSSLDERAAVIRKAGHAMTTLALPVHSESSGEPPWIALMAPAITNRAQETVTGFTEPGTAVVVQGHDVDVGPDGSFFATVSLSEGANQISALATAPDLQETSVVETIVLDTTPPPLVISSPPAGFRTASSTVRVEAQTEPGAAVTMGHHVLAADGEGGVVAWLALPAVGSHRVALVAEDAAGNTTESEITVTRTSRVSVPLIVR